MSGIDSILKSNPVMPIAGVVGLAGLGAVVLGVIALVGRFDFASKMGRFLGRGGTIGLIAGGGTAYALAVGLLAGRYVLKENKENSLDLK